VQYLRAPVMINPVDLAPDEHANLAVLPPLFVGQQVRDQQGQTWVEGNKRLLISHILTQKTPAVELKDVTVRK